MAVLSVCSLVVFIIELQIPPLTPIPGVKPGLANIVTLFMLCLGGNWKSSDAFLILVTRILLGAFITGQPLTLIYSITGGILAFAGMFILKKAIKNVPLLSVFGAILHNAAQILMAAIVFGSMSVLAYFPILLLSGIAGGLLTGFAVHFLLKKKEFIKIFYR